MLQLDASAHLPLSAQNPWYWVVRPFVWIRTRPIPKKKRAKPQQLESHSYGVHLRPWWMLYRGSGQIEKLTTSVWFHFGNMEIRGLGSTQESEPKQCQLLELVKKKELCASARYAGRH